MRKKVMTKFERDVFFALSNIIGDYKFYISDRKHGYKWQEHIEDADKIIEKLRKKNIWRTP